MTNKIRPLKKEKLRNCEYYNMQEIFDRLYSESQKGRYFYNIVEIMKCPENIKLAYRNIKRNIGSKTAGADKKTIRDLNKWDENKLTRCVNKK